MHISAPFIRRPVATSLLSIAILLAGGVAFYFLPVAALPQSRFPNDFCMRALPGASPETMASSVATPLERQFGRIAGVTEMTSTSQLGSRVSRSSSIWTATSTRLRGTFRRPLMRRPGNCRRVCRVCRITAKINPADSDILDLSFLGHDSQKSSVRFVRFHPGPKACAG